MEPPKDKLAATPDELHFVKTKIVEGGFEPTLAGDWRGRGDVVDAVIEQFECTEAAAIELVKLTVERLLAETPDWSVAGERRLMVARLKQIQALIIKQVARPKVTIHYEYQQVNAKNGKPKRDKDGNPVQRRVRVRASVTRHASPALIGKFRDIEHDIGRLLGIVEKEDVGDLKRQLRAEMAEASKGRTIEVNVHQHDGAPPKAKQIVATIMPPAPAAPALPAPAARPATPAPALAFPGIPAKK